MRRRRNFSPRVSKDVPGCSRILSAGNCVPSQLGVFDQYGAAVTVQFLSQTSKEKQEQQ